MMHREMGRLKRCQGSVLKDKCGSPAAEVLSRLFDIALHDPHYLRFGYRPDCRLHGGSESAATTSGLFPYSPGKGRDSTAAALGDGGGSVRNERIYQGEGGSRSPASKDRTPPSPVVVLLLTVSAVISLRLS